MSTASWPPLDPLLAADPQLRSRHLLVLPDDVDPDEVEALAVSRFAAARWLAAPGAAVDASQHLAVGVLRISRHTTLTGPYTVSRSAAASLGLPRTAATVFDVHCPRERGEPPWPVGGDRDGLKRVFAGGAPVRDEERTVTWLVAAARRLGGAVRIGDPQTVLTPDPWALVDLTVYSDVWLEPDAAVHVMQRVASRARLAVDGAPWHGPAPAVDVTALGLEPLPMTERLELHAVLDAEDIVAASDPEPLDGYGVTGDLGIDGELSLEVYGEDTVPLVVAGAPWAAQGVIAYRVAWLGGEPEDAELENPPLEYRVARNRAAPLVAALAAGIVRATGGEIVDDDGFLISPDDLTS